MKVEEQLREQAALVRLGEMAAVIAHEVKNPLAAVRGAIQVIGKRLPPGAREAAIVTDIVAKYAEEYRYGFPLLLDPRQELVKLANATVTPQAAASSR